MTKRLFGVIILKSLADVAELAASSMSAVGGRFSEYEKAQRSKSLISGTANGHAEAADKEQLNINADVAELADALDLGSSVFDVGVQVPSSAPKQPTYHHGCRLFLL